MKDILSNDCQNTGGNPGGAGLYKILLELLERRERLVPLAKEFAMLDKTLKQYFYGVPDFRIGRYQVKGFYCDITKANIPEKVKNKYLQKDRTWIVNIDKLKK